MGHASDLVVLGGALVAAAVLGRVGRRVGLPTIPLFMLAGIVFGPHTPGVALVDNPGDLDAYAGVGLVFLLFYLGLEFNIDDVLSRGALRLLAAGTIYLVLNVGGGAVFGLFLGWGWREAMVLAGIMGISSSAIATKILVELGRLSRPESRLILGIIVIEDVFLAVYLAGLQPVLGGADTVVAAAVDIGTGLAFLAALAAVAMWGSRVLSALVPEHDDELLVVTFAGLALLTAGTAQHLGVSDAIGAFMIGLALGTTRSAPRIRRLVHPLRDTFAAVLFVAFGLSIDPADLATVAIPLAIAVAVTVALNLAAGLVAARLHSLDTGAGLTMGVTVLARGEFALVLAAMAAGAQLDARLAPFVAGYVLVLATVSPLAAAHAATLVQLIRGTRAEPQYHPPRAAVATPEAQDDNRSPVRRAG